MTPIKLFAEICDILPTIIGVALGIFFCTLSLIYHPIEFILIILVFIAAFGCLIGIMELEEWGKNYREKR